MADPLLKISEPDRAALTQMATSPRSTRSQAVRAEIVLACAELSVAEVARHAGVDPHTAMKWKRRFQAAGMAGLGDGPRSGRPALDAEVVHTVLTRPLQEAPASRWTTRSIADATSLSQTTVSRIRRKAFPKSPEGDSPLVADQSALLAYVYVGPDRRILGLHSPAAAGMAYRPRRSSSVGAVTDPLETVLCAALVADIGAQRFAPDEATTSLFRRAVEGAPTDRTMTLLLDFTPDQAAARWLARHPRVDVVVVSPRRWLAQLHILAETVDSRQLPQLLEVQKQLRNWYGRPQGPFTWSRNGPNFNSASHNVTRDFSSLPKTSELAIVTRGLYESIADGTLHAGRRISERQLARRVELSRGAVADALRHLADDGLVEQDEDGRHLVPAPTERDVFETYTARALLGAALIRRLASRTEPLPDGIDAIFDEIVHQAREGNVTATASVDLDLQDELAKAAEMPRIEAMFLRLSLQLRLFATMLGLNYQYPKDVIVDDAVAILAGIRDHDVDTAVAAWRSKVDNAARYMLEKLPGASR